MKTVYIILIIIAAVIAFVFVYYYIDGTKIINTQYTAYIKDLPRSFDGFKITQVSDLHNKHFDMLESKVKETQPDIIVITGDIIDKRTPDVDIAIQAAKIMAQTAPTYFCSGNHEEALKENKKDIYDEFIKRLKETGVIILDDEKASIYKGSEKINIIGLSDIPITQDNNNSNIIDKNSAEHINTLLDDMASENETDIVLLHRPSVFEYTSKTPADIIFSGHAHGGQIRLPLIAENGIIAPDEGLFPKYTSGVFEQNGSTMIVSRGLGDSVFPVRINNTPEIVSVTLKTK